MSDPVEAMAGAETALDQKSSRDVGSAGKYAGTSSRKDFTKMGHQDGKFILYKRSFGTARYERHLQCYRAHRSRITMELKNELDQLVQDCFQKIKIRRGRAHQLLANS